MRRKCAASGAPWCFAGARSLAWLRTILVLAALPRGSHDKIDYQALRALLVDEVLGR